MSIWQTDDFKSNQELYEQIDGFFENLHGSKNLEYRPGQHTMALDVLDAIREKEILLIEAGVGSGKSWGYIVPLLYANQNKEKFKGFIISTSTIALQEQLISEIDRVSEMLGINIEVEVAKGKTNYICEAKLDDFLRFNRAGEEYKELNKRVSTGKIDRKDFDDVPQNIWEKINIDNVNCTSCYLKDNCHYIVKRKQWPKARALICNHDMLIEDLKRTGGDKLLFVPSLLVVDEAHALEAKIRNSYKQAISKRKLEGLIYTIYDAIEHPIEGDMEIFNIINQTFRKISSRAKKEYKQNSVREKEVLDTETSGFTCTPAIKDQLNELTKGLKQIEQQAMRYPTRNPKLVSKISDLKDIIGIFEDMRLPNSKNIYWVSFLPHTKEHIEIQYVKKDITEDAARLLGNSEYGKVFTSATLTTKQDNYKYFAEGLGIDKILGISTTPEDPQLSPYNYDENALLYYAQDVMTPKAKDHDLYLDSLAKKVAEMIRITNGKSLVLFTSKTDMKEVYQRLQEQEFPFDLLIQEEGKNAEVIKEKFKNDINSTLLASGAFWEGIDVKGESLQQVIITKLPFPVVDPIIQEKASQYTNGFEKVYIPEMLVKLKQGTGRLIRSATDQGIITILDSRTPEYIETLTDNLPFSNVTADLEKVKEFADKKLNSNKKVYQKVINP